MSDYIKVLSAGVTPIGATLMKTGQTTSYRTGDDGDLEAGRETDFFTLEEKNPFGNLYRFTGITGGYQTGGSYFDKDGVGTTLALAFPNSIVIDWSTTKGDGTKVLGYYQLASPLSHTWNQAIDWGVALSIGAFTSGWRLPNITEIYNLVYWNSNHELNYNPFNIAAFSQHSSTTVSWDTSQDRIFLSYSSNPMVTVVKSGARSTHLACRTFTVTGTTLT